MSPTRGSVWSAAQEVAVAGDHIKVNLTELSETASALGVLKGEFDDAGDIAGE